MYVGGVCGSERRRDIANEDDAATSEGPASVGCSGVAWVLLLPKVTTTMRTVRVVVRGEEAVRTTTEQDGSDNINNTTATTTTPATPC